MEKSELQVKIDTISAMEKLRCEDDIRFYENKGVTLKNKKHCFQLTIKNLQVWGIYNNRVVVTGDLAPFITLSVIDSVPAEFTFIGKGTVVASA